MISEEKIKVFISSKCGGERINFDQLVNADSRSKNDVAETAVRTSYDIVRRALSFSLEATGFIKTYAFEDGIASSMTTRQDYFNELDTSDICLFLIDNFDEKISDGLLAEITRAQNLNKKSIYLFLNHPGREKTNIQQNLRGANGVRYIEIDDIRKFINEGYKSIIHDILKIYQMYCRGDLNFVDETTTSIAIIKENFPTEITDINKQLFKNLGLTKNRFLSLVYKPDGRDVQSSGLDKLCLLVAEFLLGESNFNDIDLASLLEALKGIQSSELHNVVSKRWEAISIFYNGDLDNTIKTLEALYNQYSESTIIPKWLINDILIDLSNLNIVSDQIKSVFDFSVQEKINKQDSLIFFPLVDRFSGNVNNDIWDRNFNSFTSSPYSTTIYNLDSLFGYISNYLFAAIYYGSYTHILLTLMEIQKVLLDVVQKENNLLHKIRLMRVSILLGNEEKFKKIMGKYKASLSHSTTKEILDLYKLADENPLLYQKANWKITIFKEIGYYFSDTDYEAISKEVFNFFSQWLDTENINIHLIQNVVEAFKSNIDRLSHEKIVYLALEVINKKYYRFFDSIFDLLNRIDFSKIRQELLRGMLSQIKEIIDDENLQGRELNLQYLLIRIRKNSDIFSAEIDEMVKKYYPNFYEQEYHLEIFPNERAGHIQRYINNIEARNRIQGKDGKYIGFMDSPYIIIKKIIEFDKVSLPEELLKNLLLGIANTLFSETQTYSEKIDSIHLLLYLRRQDSLSSNYDWGNYYSNLKQNITKIEKGHSTFFEKDSSLSLRLCLIVLRITFEDDSLPDLLEVLALINNSSVREVIDSLITLYSFFENEKYNVARSLITPVVVQYVSAFCFHDNSDVRYHAVEVLYQIIESQYSSFVISRLAKMMEDEDHKVKLAITRKANLIKKHNIETFNYIMTKAKIDNNYLVRKSIENIDEK